MRMFALIILLVLPSISLARTVAPAPKVSPDPSLTDPHTDPCNDFYQYACGSWLKKTPIPPDRPLWDRGFAEIEERNQTLLRSILESYAKGGNKPANPYARKLGDFYNSCMRDSTDKTAMPLLKNLFKTIDGLNREDLAGQIAWLHLHGVPAFFALSADQDLKLPQNTTAEINQSGMGLPSRDYYLSPSDQIVELREHYEKYLELMLRLGAGEPARQARRSASDVLHLETQLAEAAMSSTDLRDPSLLYHKTKDLAGWAPTFEWSKYFAGLQIPNPGDFNVASVSYLKAATGLIASAPMPAIKAYLKVKLLEASARALPGPILDTFFQFYYKSLYGMTEMPPKWKRCEDSTDEFMGFALGRSFVAATFEGSSKIKAQEMIQNIEAAMKTLIQDSVWMDAPTKSRAFEKLSKLVNQIGYPDQWRSYDTLKVSHSYLANRFEALAFNNAFELAKIGHPVNRLDWHIPPSAVNAAYGPQLNRMVFPAGILQSPFFDRKFEGYANYGAMGMIMAHEVSHGFDDQGSQFNADGAVADWWTPTSKAEFARRGQCLAQQYERFPTAGLGHVNGGLTLGEDIGDQAGLKLAYAAWKTTWSEALKADPTAQSEQSKKFFLSFAQAWCGKDTDAFEQVRVNSDPHPPNRFRALGALINFPEFARVYQCKPGTPMAPKEQCSVW